MMREKTAFSIIFCIVFFLLSQADALGCSCAEKPSVLDAFEGSSLVVVTRVVSVEKAEERDESAVLGVKSTKMVVEKVYKGNVKVGDELTFAQGAGGDCVWTFSEEFIGDRFLFYLGAPTRNHPLLEEWKEGELRYYAFACGRSVDAEGATDDFLYLNNLEKARGRTRLSGTLGSRHKDSPSFAGVKIRIIGKNKTYEAGTDKNGVYEIYDLPAGEYLVEADISRGWKVDSYMLLKNSPLYRKYFEENRGKVKNQIPVEIKDKRHAALDLTFTIDAAISGKVLSPSGKPMKDVRVRAVSVELAEGVYRGEFSYTNEKGEFKIDEIAEGNYLLVVNDDGEISSDEPFGTLFYPGTPDRKSASVVAVAPGKYLGGINIQIPKTEELLEISGRLLFSDGKPVVDEPVSFEVADKKPNISGNAKARTDAQGRFTLKILKGSSGRLFGTMYIYLDNSGNCPELEKIIKPTGKAYAEPKTNEIEIEATSNLTEIKLIFPFSSCAKARD